MPLGILQSSLDARDLSRAFDLAARTGADGLEVVCSEEKDLRDLLSAPGVKLIRRLMRDTGLEAPGIALMVLARSESLFGKPAVASAAKELIRGGMEAAGEIGMKMVLLPFLGKATIEFEHELDKVIEALPELAEQAEEAGLTLGIESTLNVDQQLHLLDHLAGYGSPKICYDAAMPQTRKLDPATWLRDLGPERICQICLRDVRVGEEGQPPEWNVALGEGDVDFPAVANAMRAMAYDGWTILAAPATEDPAAAAEAGVRFGRQLLGQA